MMILLQMCSLLLWLIVIPFCSGLLFVPLFPKKERTPGAVFLSGYFLMLALFELVGIPIVIFVTYQGFSVLSAVFGILAVLTALLGIFVWLKGRKKKEGLIILNQKRLREMELEEKLCFGIFFALLFFQLYMAFTHASFDGDDSYYGVQGAIAQQIGSLYRINPNTGRSAPLDVRHALALIPVWEAFLGKMSGLPSTVIAHSVVPLVLIPLTYLLYFQIGKKLLSEKKEMLSMFMIILALLQMFGNVSIYTNETFLLTRTWQGKSLAGNLVIPAVFWIFLCLFEEEKEEGQKKKEAGLWLLLACVNLTGGVSSSLAVLLSSLMVAGFAFLFMIKERKFSILVKAGVSCIPSAAYVLTYLLLLH